MTLLLTVTGHDHPGVLAGLCAVLPPHRASDSDVEQVVVHGRLRTLVNNLETANVLKSYLVEFDYGGGRMHLKGFKEVPNAAH